MNITVDLGVVLALLTIVGGPWGLTWWEIRSLRRSRHDTNGSLAALKVDVANVQADMTDVKDDVRQVRDALLKAGVINGGKVGP